MTSIPGTPPPLRAACRSRTRSARNGIPAKAASRFSRRTNPVYISIAGNDRTLAASQTTVWQLVRGRRRVAAARIDIVAQRDYRLLIGKTQTNPVENLLNVALRAREARVGRARAPTPSSAFSLNLTGHRRFHGSSTEVEETMRDRTQEVRVEVFGRWRPGVSHNSGSGIQLQSKGSDLPARRTAL